MVVLNEVHSIFLAITQSGYIFATGVTSYSLLATIGRGCRISENIASPLAPCYLLDKRGKSSDKCPIFFLTKKSTPDRLLKLIRKN